MRDYPAKKKPKPWIPPRESNEYYDDGNWQCPDCGEEFYFEEFNPIDFGWIFCPHCGERRIASEEGT